jgi:AbrB family looped-hinge helix DNA binding protein
MSTATVTLSTEGQVVIPKDIRDALHWEAGTELTVTPAGNGVMLKAAPKKRGKRLEDLIGMLQHDGSPISIEELCKPVDYRADREESEKRSR